MFGDRFGNRFVFTVETRVIASHHALQFGKFPDHAR